MTPAATTIAFESRAASVGDYFALLKPRVMSLVIFTAFAGMLVAPAAIDPFTAFTALLCIAVGAGASGALNMAYDCDIDALMARKRSIGSAMSVARLTMIIVTWLLRSVLPGSRRLSGTAAVNGRSGRQL